MFWSEHSYVEYSTTYIGFSFRLYVGKVHFYVRCLVQVGHGIELEAVGLLFEPYQWRPCGVT